MAIRTRILDGGAKRYQARVFLGLDHEGKRLEATKTFRTKADAVRWEREQKVAHDKGTYVRPSQQPLGRYVREWMEGPMRGVVRERTWQNYDRALRRYVYNDPIARTPLGRLTTQSLESYYAQLFREGGKGDRCGPLSPKSIRNIHSILHTALKAAAKHQLIGANPANGATLPKAHQKIRNTVPTSTRSNRQQVLTAAQVQRLLEEAAKRPRPRQGRRSGNHSRPWTWSSPRSRNRWHALWHVLANGGLRPSEALALTWKDIDWTHQSVNINKALVTGLRGGDWIVERPKTERSFRTVTLPTETMQALREHQGQQQVDMAAAGNRYRDHGFVFSGERGGPVDLKNATKRHFRPLLTAADLPPIRVYDLRHTHASLLLSASVPVHIVSARLGHASAKMTLDVYSHALPDQQRDALRVYENYMATTVTPTARGPAGSTP